jgi:serine phosphatase RsbU (regulator of sigma subunit)/pSer/pThr/pTyr-binding forkhead associated (FHA) protein
MTGARLEVSEPSGRRVIPVDKPVFTIGRRTGSDLCVLGRDVSREHAEIVVDEDRYILRDRSSNGTFVNDSAVSSEHVLRHGDSIRLGRSGDARLRFLIGPEDHDGRPDTVSAVSAVHDLRQLAALFEGLRAMGSAHALDEVLAVVLDLTIEFTGAERGFIMLANGKGELEFTLGRARGQVTLPGRTFETSRRIPEEVFTTGEGRSVSDLLDEGMSSVHIGTIALGIRHVLCLPLRLVRYAQAAGERPGQKCIGVLYLDSRHRGSLLSDTTRAGLETLATEAATAIENARLYREEVEKLRLEQEMNIAAEIQKALLPEPGYKARGIEAAAVSVPCRAIGGDFYEYLELSDGRGFGFALGDVAGKGPSAALLTAAIQAVFSSRALEGDSPARTLASVNRAVIRRAVQARFVTMAYGVIDPGGSLTYCNGGHNPPLVIGTRGTRRLARGGMVLGMFPTATYEQETLQLDPGDVIVAFSDGVSESMNEAGDMFEEGRIEACVRAHLDEPPAEMIDRVLEAVRHFSEGTPQHDDLTLVVLRYFGSAA